MNNSSPLMQAIFYSNPDGYPPIMKNHMELA